MTAPRTVKAGTPFMARTVLHIVKVETLLTGLTEPLIDKVVIRPTVQMAQPTAVVEIQPTVPTERLAGKLATLPTATESCAPNTALQGTRRDKAASPPPELQR